MDLACEQLFEEISIKVMVEKEGGEEWKRYSPLTEEELATYNAMLAPPIKPHPFMFADEVAEVGGELNPSLGFDGGLPLLTYPVSPVAGVEEEVTLHPPTPPSSATLGVGQPSGTGPMPTPLQEIPTSASPVAHRDVTTKLLVGQHCIASSPCPMVAEEKGIEGVVPLAEAPLVGDVATLPPKNASSTSSPCSLHSTSMEGGFVPLVDPPPMFPATTTAPTPIDINLSPAVVEAMALDAPLPPPPAAEDEVQPWGRPLLLLLPNSAKVVGMRERRMSTPYTR